MPSSSQSYSFTSYSSSSSTNGGPPQKTTFAERSYTDDSGTVTERMRQLPGQQAVYETTERPSGRQVEGPAGASNSHRITDVTDADMDSKKQQSLQLDCTTDAVPSSHIDLRGIDRMRLLPATSLGAAQAGQVQAYNEASRPLPRVQHS
ncbi:hypothetical protein F5Y18DRAFT_433683 [Xylariaceae sp. FL1019]|nr:hypothetical protein F5Y18DRAFT_433683 [Xylariaceae sp. FL1019]